MFSNKENVNILTALLIRHGIRHVVVCPGSRNAPIVHNLDACPEVICHPVTDERSAAFYALGMTQALGQPVAVCVTSGTALLNVAPAIAEAYYQHCPVVVVSADRPQAWIDQLDGQTLPQADALGRFVRRAVTLPEPHDDVERWHCNRLVNEALMERRGPVHINVPITEPLFDFTQAQLPNERVIERQAADISSATLSHVCRMFMQARRPLLIAGQPMNPGMDEAVMMIEGDERYVPDFVLYTGGSIVSKRLKHFLRKAKETWAVNVEGEVNDTFMNLTNVIQGDGEIVADMVRFNLEQQPHPFVQMWEELLTKVRAEADGYQPSYSQMAAVKHFEQRLDALRLSSSVHYANSTAIRLANVFAHHQVWCNRGVNGIEGSLSTAAGFSLVSAETTFCVIGDLSFFYDQNALWNQELCCRAHGGNLRVLLLNNGRGGIFYMLPGLEQSPARDRFVAAEHQTSAEGICRQNAVGYRAAMNEMELQQGIEWLLTEESERAMVLEVFTDPVVDEQTYKAYMSIFKRKQQ